MADRYTSRIALVLDGPSGSVQELVQRAGAAGDLDRGTPVKGQGDEAMEVNWGGRMQRAVVRRLTDDDGTHLLRTEAYVGDGGPKDGIVRQALLLQALARHVDREVLGVRDLEAQTDHPVGWVHRAAVAGAPLEDLVAVRAEGTGTHWVRTHGAARFDVPDLELYGLSAGQVAPATTALRHVHEQLLRTGLRTDLTLPDGTPVYLVPVLQAWQHCDLDWPGVGRAGKERGPGLDGPRATLSVLRKPRFGSFKVDLDGVRATLRPV